MCGAGIPARERPETYSFVRGNHSDDNPAYPPWTSNFA